MMIGNNSSGRGSYPPKMTTDHHNSNNKTLPLTTSTSNTTSNINNKKKPNNNTKKTKKKLMIKIKPFHVPPQLPNNYYETSSHFIFDMTLQYLEHRIEQSTFLLSSLRSSSKSNKSNANCEPYNSPLKKSPPPVAASDAAVPQVLPTPTTYSYQSAYNNTVHLVSHQYGSPLYSDLIRTLEIACERVLPTNNNNMDQSRRSRQQQKRTGTGTTDDDDDNNTNDDNIHVDVNEEDDDINITSSSPSTSTLMDYIIEQYGIYTDFLLLCKHVLAPLDRTWQWQDKTRTPIPIHSSTILSSSKNKKKNNHLKTTSATAVQGVGVMDEEKEMNIRDENDVLEEEDNNDNDDDDNEPMKVSGAKEKSSTTTSSSSSSHALQNIWQVGLACFLRRLQYLKLDDVLYQQWLETFLYDWNGSSSSTAPLYTTTSSTTTTTTPFLPNRRSVLQQVWYLWQDLRYISQLQLQSDLEHYWANVAFEWSTSSSGGCTYLSNQFILFCYDKHIRCYHYKHFLPIEWLWNILDIHLFQPHFMFIGSIPSVPTMASSYNNIYELSITTTTTTSGGTSCGNNNNNTPLLLQDENLHPLLEEALLQHQQQPYLLLHDNDVENQRLKPTPTSSSSMMKTIKGEEYHRSGSSGSGQPTKTVQILWYLASRLPGGHTLLATAIQRFARIQGIQRVQPPSKPPPPPPVAVSQPVTSQSTIPTNTNAVEELVKLQHALSSLIQTLPSAVENGFGVPTNATAFRTSTGSSSSSSNNNNNNANNIISLKAVWEEVVNIDVEPSIAEQLAKFLDSILKSSKKIDYYQNQMYNNNNNNNVRTTSTATNMSAVGNITNSSSTSSTAWLQKVVMGLFVPLAAKDVFEAFYKKDLAKRLLWNKFVSMDIEKQVCSLLKAECGAGYTSKMEGMFQDIEWSRETMLVYKESMLLGTNAAATSTTTTKTEENKYDVDAMDLDHHEKELDQITKKDPSSTNTKMVDMEVQVLTTGYWPVYTVYPNLRLPSYLVQPQLLFTDHYKAKYQGRRMTWQYALGHCVVSANGFNKPYDLVLSLCQALTLLQFNIPKNQSQQQQQTMTTKSSNNKKYDSGWTLPELQVAIGLDDRDEMNRVLQSLSLGREETRILRKLDYDRGDVVTKKSIRQEVDDRDHFVINWNFTAKARRVKISNISMKETKEEHDKTIETISRDRLYLIDAVLVRILKARKTILHQQLITNVMEQVKVPVGVVDIKMRIESLIEREYMERDVKDHNKYNYLA